MNNFKDFGIKPRKQSMEGDKIKMSKVLNREITVHGFKVDDSKAKPGTKYLMMQISIAETKHIVFTGSKNLIELIEQVPVDKFPFTTTIIEENERFEFT